MNSKQSIDGRQYDGNSKTAKTEYKRDKWASKTEFILSSLGYAIGIGNVVRFPYLCYRSGGGAFLVPYLIMLFFCGVPLYFLETSLGQFSSSGCITVFRISPLFKGAGIAMILVNFIVTTYFVTFYAYALLFLYHSFQETLPWSECSNPWNTKACIKLGESSIILLNQNVSSQFGVKSSSEEFFNKEILRISDSIETTGEIVWPLFICNALAWTATYLCMSNGIKSIGKVVYFTSTFPFLVLFVLLLRGLTLPGAMRGIYFYIYPQWDHLTSFKVWCDAALQIFFSLGPGWGGIINMSSFNNFHNNNKMDSIIIPISNSATSITAGFVVFSVLGFMSHKTGIPVSSVAAGGPGLAFITYPEAISLLPWPNLWAILFFVMLFFLGASGVFVTAESVITSITDQFPRLRRYSIWMSFLICFSMWACSTIFTFNSGMYWLTLLDWYSASIPIILICIVEVVIVGWIYGARKFAADVEFMIKEEISWFWLLSWKVSTPIILIVMFVITILYTGDVTYNNQQYPKWAIDTGWGSCYLTISCIPLYIGYYILYMEDGDLFQRFMSSVSASKHWGPADESNKLAWLKQVKLKQIALPTKPEVHSKKLEIIQTTSTV